jgi:S1-C subfamily serine protease
MDIARPIIDALVKNGVYEYPYLGFSSIDELSFRERRALGFPEVDGIYVTEIQPGGPAEKAGLRAGSVESGVPDLPLGGDLISAVDGQSVTRYDQLYAFLIKHKQPGDEVILTVARGDQQEELILQLGERPKTEQKDW